MKFLLSLLVLASVIAVIGIALTQKDKLEGPMTRLQESLGYPAREFLEPLDDFVYLHENTQAFVVMSTLPGMQAQKAFASTPHTLRIRRLLVVDPSLPFTNTDLLAMQNVQVVESKFSGPIGKYLTVTDPALSAQLGISRAFGSHDILIFLDDDM